LDAFPVVISGVTSSQNEFCNGIYEPFSKQCGWPVYRKTDDHTIWLSYFGDERQGKWRVQNAADRYTTKSHMKASCAPADYPENITGWKVLNDPTFWDSLTGNATFSVQPDVTVKPYVP
jgi:hypothetical protein